MENKPTLDERTQRIHDKLERELGPIIMAGLKDKDVVEIMLNSDGKIWIEAHGKGMYEAGVMNRPMAESLLGTIAAALGTTITRESPILEGELPLDGSRFEGVIPPIVAFPTFAIRKKAIKVFPLSDYVASGTLTQNQVDKIEELVVAHKNILIVGGTGSGKTTLTNAVIDAITRLTPKDRLNIMEDTSEIQCNTPNKVILRSSATVSMQMLLKVMMRMRPDRIIVGEVRGGEALALLKAWNTGHPGGIATVHANNAEAALVRIEQLIAEVSQNPMPQLVAEAVNAIISIKRVPQGRKVEEILLVDGYDATKDKYLFRNVE
jgi:type IV secretion system protein VirB11